MTTWHSAPQGRPIWQCALRVDTTTQKSCSISRLRWLSASSAYMTSISKGSSARRLNSSVKFWCRDSSPYSTTQSTCLSSIFRRRKSMGSLGALHSKRKPSPSSMKLKQAWPVSICLASRSRQMIPSCSFTRLSRKTHLMRRLWMPRPKRTWWAWWFVP